MAQETMRVVGPGAVAGEGIPVTRVPVGFDWDYKPCLIKNKDGTLLLIDFHNHRERHGWLFDEGLREHSVLFKSSDGGLTWSKGKHLPLLGREPYFSMTEDGTIFITTHFLSSDVLNHTGGTYIIIHRSADGGETWQTMDWPNTMFGGCKTALSARNVFERPDGSLILGVGVGYGKDYIAVSTDGGLSWKVEQAVFTGYDPATYSQSPFMEGVMFYSPSGRMMMMTRLDLRELRFTGTVPNLPGSQEELPKDFDNFECSVLFESKDNGKTWDPVRGAGFTGMMYPSFVALGNNKMLFTFTVRVPVCSHMGVQAVVIEEKPDGSFVIDTDKDRIVIDEKTPDYLTSGGGFGPTIRIEGSRMLTAYSYRYAPEQVRQKLEQGGFDHNKYQEVIATCPTKVELAIWEIPEQLL